MKGDTSRLPVTGMLLIAGSAVAASEAQTPVAPVWQVAIAHDFLLPDDGPPVHRYPPQAAGFDAAGRLRGFTDDRGTVTWDLPVGHAGNDGLVAWGRWGSGRTGGDGRHANVDITGGEGARNALYYVAGVPAQETPTGAARYSVLGGQVTPTAGEGGMAATTFLENGALEADFGAGRARITLAITVPSGRYELTAENLRIVGGRFETAPDSRLAVTGALCFAGCAAYLEGFLAGPAAERAGLAYHIDIEALTEDVDGVVAWRRD
ncbi:hypothetical protein [Immundisolibacter sp.]|uniref:hypothetical protein n=1 Tax=Immundisolibacter sp. TaxID=1934948 RepID=UPI002614F237|nr:hypothetical protein [Immundisolibacter sp.]MDD3650924.1 hypothetical protein [Immundisolibacter sp.]